MTDVEREARRQMSSALFNNRHFADCAQHAMSISAAGKDVVTVRQVAAAAGISDSLVRPVVLRLVAAGVLRKLPKDGRGRSPQHYEVADIDLLSWVSLPDVPTAARA